MQLFHCLIVLLLIQFMGTAVWAQDGGAGNSEEARPTQPAAPAAEPSDEEQLKALLMLYRNDQIGAAEYQKRRSEILGRTKGDLWRRDSVRGPKRASTTEAGASSGKANAKYLEAAIVPGADLLIRIDVRSARQYPMFAYLKKLQGQAAESEAVPGAVPSVDELEKLLGLKDDDVDGVLISADLDKLNLSLFGQEGASGMGQSMNDLVGVAAIQVAKPVTLEQLKKAAQELAKDKGGVELKEKKLGGMDVLEVGSDSEDEVPAYVAVMDGRTILLGINEASLRGALERAGGKVVEPGPGLFGSLSALDEKSQMKIAFVIPEPMREMLGMLGMMGQGAGGPGGPGADPAGEPPPPGAEPGGPGPGGAGGGGKGPEAGMMAAAMLSQLRSVSLGVRLDDRMNLVISGDLGDSQAANGLNMMLEMMKPQMISSVAEKMGKSPQDIPADLVTSKASGTRLTISAAIDQKMLEVMASE